MDAMKVRASQMAAFPNASTACNQASEVMHTNFYPEQPVHLPKLASMRSVLDEASRG